MQARKYRQFINISESVTNKSAIELEMHGSQPCWGSTGCVGHVKPTTEDFVSTTENSRKIYANERRLLSFWLLLA